MTPARVDWVNPLRTQIEAGIAAYSRKRQSQPEDPLLLAAIGLRETWLGHMPGYIPNGSPDGVGDHGHGRGYWQIDDRGPFRHLIEPAPWPVEHQVAAACEVLEDARRKLQDFVSRPRYLLAVICAYNAGTGPVYRQMAGGWDPNRCTYESNYGDDVMGVYAALKSAELTPEVK